MLECRKRLAFADQNGADILKEHFRDYGVQNDT